MPRKNKTPATQIRVRDNQRRSRARQRELVEDLQRRVREYEQREVHATLEMQHAARAVALENSCLRAMLARHGVSNDDINRFVLGDAAASAGPSSGLQSCSPPLMASGSMVAPATGRDVASSIQTESHANPDDEEHSADRSSDPAPESSAFAQPAPSPRAPGMRMLCDTAAAIITNMHGHGDKALAFAALDCQQTHGCLVKNTRVMEVMDSI